MAQQTRLAGPARVVPLNAPRPSNAGTFDENCSLVLIGIRGVGKSSLAIMAAKALNFRLVDADQQFQQKTGLSKSAYKSLHGAQEYRSRETKLMRLLLEDNLSGAVITLNSISIVGSGRDILQQYTAKLPVILLLRDSEDIHRYIRVWEADAIIDLVDKVTPLCRTVSSFEFYNLSEEHLLSPESPSESHPQYASILVLKRVERDFLHLISSIRRQPQQHEYTSSQTQSQLYPESKAYSYALSLPLSQWMSTSHELRGADLMVDAVELIIDTLVSTEEMDGLNSSMATAISRQICSVRRTFGLPLILSIDLPSILHSYSSEDIDSAAGEKLYFEMLQHALRLCPDYLCIDIDIARRHKQTRRLMSKRGSTKLIGHFHHSAPGHNAWSSPSRMELLKLAKVLGFQIIRLTQEATSMLDNFTAQQFLNTISGSKEVSLIAYNTGQLGRLSCCLNPIFTPVTHPALSASSRDESRGWLLTVQACQRALYSSFTLDEMVFGIYGSNVTVSLSPAMHQAAYRISSMPHSYRIFQHDTIDHLDDLLQDPCLGGISITAPFKMEVLNRIQFLSPSARIIKAVNTIVPLRSKDVSSLSDRNRRGPILALYGENTDWIGIHTCIKRNLSPINAVSQRTTGLVLGAGGMARAAIFAMIQLGLRSIFVFNRTERNAKAMINQFCEQEVNVGDIELGRKIMVRESYVDDSSETKHDDDTRQSCRIIFISTLTRSWPTGHSPPTVIVSCISALSSRAETGPDITVPPNWLASSTGGVCIELAYDPLETPLLKQIKRLRNLKWIAVDGLQVLPEQGIAQFELFTGRKAPQNHMRDAIPKAYEEQSRSGLRSSTLH